MKITMIMASSLDGKTTDGWNENAHIATPKKDKAFLQQTIENASLLFMGRNTFEYAYPNMQHREGRRRIVWTHNPETLTHLTIPGQLEFTHDNPADKIEQLEKEGYTEAILLGGSRTNASFLEYNLVTRMEITTVPIILGKGKELFGVKAPLRLHLVSHEQWGDGAIHYIFDVLKKL